VDLNHWPLPYQASLPGMRTGKCATEESRIVRRRRWAPGASVESERKSLLLVLASTSTICSLHGGELGFKSPRLDCSPSQRPDWV
jgi:hypothetical protein